MILPQLTYMTVLHYSNVFMVNGSRSAQLRMRVTEQAVGQKRNRIRVVGTQSWINREDVFFRNVYGIMFFRFNYMK